MNAMLGFRICDLGDVGLINTHYIYKCSGGQFAPASAGELSGSVHITVVRPSQSSTFLFSL